MKHYETKCWIDESGRIPLAISEKIRDVFKELKKKEVQITIAKPKVYSTNKQRNYYFAAIVEAFQNYFAAHGKWYEKEWLHEKMMTEIGELWEEEPNPFTNQISMKRRSYNSLSTIEAETYHEKCRAEAASRGFHIDEPNEGANE